MPVILCHNRRITREGQTVKCGRFLVDLTIEQIEALKDGGVCKLRCSACNGEAKWIEVKYVDSKLTFTSGMNRETFDVELCFDEVIICEQFG